MNSLKQDNNIIELQQKDTKKHKKYTKKKVKDTLNKVEAIENLKNIIEHQQTKQKDIYIKVRVDDELKEKFKLYAKKNKTNMNEILVQYIKSTLEKNDFKIQNKEIIESRIATIDKKLNEVKEKLNNRSSTQTKKKKRKFFFW